MGFGFDSAGPLAASGGDDQFLGLPPVIFNHEVAGLEDGVPVARVRVSVPADEAFIFIQEPFDAVSEELMREG